MMRCSNLIFCCGTSPRVARNFKTFGGNMPGVRRTKNPIRRRSFCARPSLPLDRSKL
jgi:hypothetical protein